MKEEIYKLHQKIVNVLGTGEQLKGKCELISSFVVAELYKNNRNKRFYLKFGRVFGIGHWWCEIEGEIIDVSVEQFGFSFEFPISKERKNIYKDVLEIRNVNDDVYYECFKASEDVFSFN